MNTPTLTITIEQKNKKQETIHKLRFDKDITKQIDLTKPSTVKYLSKKIEDLILDMDNKKIIEYVWKEAILRNRKNGHS